MSAKKSGPLPKILTVGQVAERSGVAVSTIHFYESKGLIASWRTDGNQRRYPRSVLRQVSVIKVAQQLGIPLAEVKETLGMLPADQVPTAEHWRAIATSWRGRLDERIERLTLLRDRLTGCIGCGCLSVEDCPLRNPDDVAGSEGTGPRHLEARRRR
jgi:MerR family transcriptional regulator, redox-sensitive transcriptional activator SoxR